MAGSPSKRGHTSTKRQPSSNIQVQATNSTPKTIPKHKQAPLGSRLPVAYTQGSPAWKSQQPFMDNCTFGFSAFHGHGVFATKDIEAGTLIIQEKALWVVATHIAINGTFSTTMDYTLPRLNLIGAYNNTKFDAENLEEGERDQLDLRTLCGGFGLDEAVKGGIGDCMTTMSEHFREVLILNGVAESTPDGNPGYAAVFRASSRLNHSCAPNAERMRSQLNDGSVWCHVYATSPIKKHEEIFINYVDPLARSEWRQNMFQSRWHFTCTCRFCRRPKLPIVASDYRREKMEDAINFMKKADAAHAVPKPPQQTDAAHLGHLESCDRQMLGVSGWQALDQFAKEEGVNDIKLYNSLCHAADAARRLRKLSLEMKLVDRMLAVCRTYVISEEQLRNVSSRRDDLRRMAIKLAVMAAQQLAQKDLAV